MGRAADALRQPSKVSVCSDEGVAGPTPFLYYNDKGVRFLGENLASSPDPLSLMGMQIMAICVRGVRGATTCDENSEAEILAATRELLLQLLQANDMACDDIGSAIFTVTADLNAAFPAKAARDLGWDLVPMMCCQEIPVPGSLSKCIRVMLLWNTHKAQDEIVHVYLRGARSLRPDLTVSMPVEPEGDWRSRQ